MTVKELGSMLRDENASVVLFGTGLMAQQAAMEPEIGSRIVYCIDNDKDKDGRHVKLNDVVYNVVSPMSIKNENWQNNIILIVSTHFEEIQKECDKLFPEARTYVYPLLRMNFESEKEKLKRRVWDECDAERALLAEQCPKTMIANIEYSEDKLIIPRVMIMPTTRCNLKCVGCSSMLPHFKNPVDLDIEQILKDLTTFFSAIDCCVRITVGGEPFLYRHLNKILEYLINEPKLNGILLITNGTIVPNDELLGLLQNDKILVELSDYGFLEQMSRVINAFERSRVNFIVLTAQVWDEFGDTRQRGRSESQLRFSYLNCEQSRLIKAIYGGRFFTCARSARMFALGAYESERDYFVLDPEDINLSEKISNMYASELADACNHCDLGTFPARKITAGIQLDGTLKKSGYTIVKRDELEKLRFNANIM